LLCDICLRTANRDGTVDIFTTSHRLAKCDQNLINNINYYLLAHFVIFENCLKIDSNFKCDSFRAGKPISFSKQQTRKYFKYIQETRWLDTIKYETGNKSGSTIIPKSRIIKCHLSYVLVGKELHFLFDTVGPKWPKIFKISLTFRFDKLSNSSKSVHTGENSQILTVSNKNSYLFNEFVCNLRFFWHSWTFKTLVSLEF
jgi:hypothetical protein